MDSLASKLNVVVLLGLAVGAYFAFTHKSPPTAPPDDAWFQAEVLKQTEPVLVKFGAEWCPPCRAMDPVLDKLAEQWRGRMAVVRVNVDDHQDLAEHYGVSGIPHVFLFRNGEVVADTVGFAGAEELEKWVATNSK